MCKMYPGSDVYDASTQCLHKIIDGITGASDSLGSMILLLALFYWPSCFQPFCVWIVGGLSKARNSKVSRLLAGVKLCSFSLQ